MFRYQKYKMSPVAIELFISRIDISTSEN